MISAVFIITSVGLPDASQPLPPTCKDDTAECTDWAARGECEKNSDYMQVACCKACKLYAKNEGLQKLLVPNYEWPLKVIAWTLAAVLAATLWVAFQRGHLRFRSASDNDGEAQRRLREQRLRRFHSAEAELRAADDGARVGSTVAAARVATSSEHRMARTGDSLDGAWNASWDEDKPASSPSRAPAPVSKPARATPAEPPYALHESWTAWAAARSAAPQPSGLHASAHNGAPPPSGAAAAAAAAAAASAEAASGTPAPHVNDSASASTTLLPSLLPSLPSLADSWVEWAATHPAGGPLDSTLPPPAASSSAAQLGAQHWTRAFDVTVNAEAALECFRRGIALPDEGGKEAISANQSSRNQSQSVPIRAPMEGGGADDVGSGADGEGGKGGEGGEGGGESGGCGEGGASLAPPSARRAVVGAVLLLAIEDNDPASLHLVQHVWPDAEVQALLRGPTMIAMRLQASKHRAEASFWARELATGRLPAIALLWVPLSATDDHLIATLIRCAPCDRAALGGARPPLHTRAPTATSASRAHPLERPT